MKAKRGVERVAAAAELLLACPGRHTSCICASGATRVGGAPRCSWPNALARVGEIARRAQEGADRAKVVFDVAHFDEVAEIMKPRRRRFTRAR